MQAKPYELAVVPFTGDILTFAERNIEIVKLMCSTDLQVDVSTNQKNWVDFVKLKRCDPEKYQYISQKLQLSDADLVGLNALLIKQIPKDLTMSEKTDRLTVITDKIVNMFVNQVPHVGQ